MKLEPVYKSAPVVREGEMLLYGRGTSPDGHSVLQPFTKHIVWLRESETKIRLVHGGVLVNEASTYGDVGIYLSSVASAVAQAIALEARLKVTMTSTLVIETVTLVYDTPVIRQVPSPGHELVAIRDWNHFQEPEHRYYRVGNPWWVGEMHASAADRVLLQSAAVADEQVLWSSCMTPAISLALLDELAFLPGVVDRPNLNMAYARQKLATALGIGSTAQKAA